jgi:hypothetical protein
MIEIFSQFLFIDNVILKFQYLVDKYPAISLCLHSNLMEFIILLLKTNRLHRYNPSIHTCIACGLVNYN